MKLLLDTNIALYLLGGRLKEPLPPGEYHVSVITELELLSYPLLTDSEEANVRAFLGDVAIIELSSEIKAKTIQLRRQHKIKLPDAIIAATALSLRARLLTNDSQLLRLSGVKATTLEIK